MVMFFLVAKSINVLIVSVVGGCGVKTLINVLAGHVGKHKPAGLCLECLLTYGKHLFRPRQGCDVAGSE